MIQSVLSLAAAVVVPFLLSGQVVPAEDLSSLEARVKLLYDSGHFAEAAQLSEGQSSLSATLLLYRGLSLARTGQLPAAATAFEKGLHEFPGDKRFPLELAGVAYSEKDTAKAKRLLHRALTLDRRDKYGNDFLGTLYLLDGNLAAALFHWNRIGKPVLQDVHFEPVPPLTPLLRERTFALSGGQTFTLARLRAAEANLGRLDVLPEVRYDLLPRRQDDRYELLIRTVPLARPLVGWVGRLLPSLRQLPYQGLALDADNLRQRAINLNVLGRWDPDKRRINVALSGPLKENPRTEYRFFVDLRNETWNLQSQFFSMPGGMRDLLVKKAEAGGEFAFGLSPRLQWTLRGSLAYRSFGQAPRDPLFARGWTAQLDNRFDYLLWDSPDRRLRIDSFASLRIGRLFSQTPSRLITTRAVARALWFPQAKGDRYEVTQRLGAGRIFGAAPLDEVFILGMERDNDQDLWLRGIAGTRNGQKGNAPFGREYVIGQTDVSRKFFELPLVRVYAGPFFDIGAVGDSSHRYGSRGVLYNTGVQASMKTLGSVTLTLVYGRDLTSGRGVFYTAVSR